MIFTNLQGKTTEVLDRADLEALTGRAGLYVRRRLADVFEVYEPDGMSVLGVLDGRLWPETEVEAQLRYRDATHAMQSGVAADLAQADAAATPKHLRVGVNSALVETGALVELLVAKGVVTRQEWYVALADAMTREVERYEQLLTTRLGHPVKLF